MAWRICLLLLVLWGCTPSPDPPESQTGGSTFIAAHTAGEISRTSPIEIQFTRDVVKAGDLGPATAPLRFDPAIDGTASWRDVRTLVFTPTTSLPSGAAYRATLDLGDFFSKADPFHFNFRTLRQALSIQIDPPRARDAGDLRGQFIGGRILSADHADGDAFTTLIDARQEGRTLPVRWTHSADGRVHSFDVDDITRGRRASQVIIRWNGGGLESGFQGERTLTVLPLDTFNLVLVEAKDQPEQHVLLTFSDPLEQGQDLRGLVRAGDADFRLDIEGEQVRAYPAQRLTGAVEVAVEPGIRNVAGGKLRQRWNATVTFADTPPQVRAVGRGVIAPDSEGVLMPFEAVNVQAVDVRITKIFETNMLQFLQSNRLEERYELYRVGEVIHEQRIPLDDSLDLKQWNRHVLDLAALISPDPGALYQVELGIRHTDSLYTCSEIAGQRSQNESPFETDERLWRYYEQTPYSWRDRDNPCHRSYFNFDRHLRRNLLASNLGMLAKRGSDGPLHIYVTDLVDAEPVSGVAVTLYGPQQQSLGEAVSDAAGNVTFADIKEPFAAIARRDDERGYLLLRDYNALNLSRFDVGGVDLSKGVNGFIYGERGVWRPGDTLYLTFVLQDRDNRLPDDHPVVMTLTDPRGRRVFRQVMREGVGNFYHQAIPTQAEWITGDYYLNVDVGAANFTRPVKIETVMPNRLKLELDVDPLGVGARLPEGRLRVRWLHGAVAKNLKADVQMRLQPTRTQFDTFRDFTFDDPARQYPFATTTVFDAKVNAQGFARFPIEINNLNAAGGRLRAVFNTKAFEPGGAFSSDRSSQIIDPYPVYVGLKLPEGDRWSGALDAGVDHQVEIATLDFQGKPLARQSVEITLHRLEWRWWWDRNARRVSTYNARQLTTPIRTATVATDARGVATWALRVDEESQGRYLLQIRDADGHSTGAVVYVRNPWGQATSGQASGAAMLAFSSDRDNYQAGDRATLSIPSSAGGRALIAIERGDQILRSEWVDTVQGTTTYSFDITPDMAPNVYANVHLIQPHAQTTNDLPIRLYGVIPILVDNPDTLLEPQIVAPDVIRPEATVDLAVRERAGRAMTYTLAVVDEGLLDLTRHQTPDPRSFFYARQALKVKTWDVYDLVLGALGGELRSLLRVGGGGTVDLADNAKANRFEPVIRFLGPFQLNAGATDTHQIQMPRYVGSVRIMVVAGEGSAYGHAEQTVPVRKPLMVLGTLPRVLGPGEEVALPVSVFAMNDDIRDVRVRITPNPLLQVRGATEQNLRFDATGEQLATFQLRVAEQVGLARVQVEAVSGRERALFDIELDVRNPNPVAYRTERRTLAAGESAQLDLAPLGMRGTNAAHLEISAVPPVDLGDRLEYLVRYPHGCLEQVTSAVFPQLFLSQMGDLFPGGLDRIEDNIRAGVRRIAGFQRFDGGFAYWPGAGEANAWATNYAGHFLLAAKDRGYRVDDALLDRWLGFQSMRARAWSAAVAEHPRSQAYRLHLLALAGKPEIGAMNRFREQNKRDVSGWLLASAYALAGQGDAARQLATRLDANVPEYLELSGTFGSGLRDRALILDAMDRLGLAEQTHTMTQRVVEDLNAERGYNTQAIGMGLMAVARQIANADAKAALVYDLGQGQQQLQSEHAVARLALDAENAATLQLRNPNQGPLYVRLVQQGQPLRDPRAGEAEGLRLDVRYTDLEGRALDVTQLQQGQDFIASVRVRHPGDSRGDYQELALTQIFPSGWEIMNQRLNNDQQATPDPAEYTDIRDDRILRYFDQPRGGDFTFTLMLNATYQGRFYQPPVQVEAMYDPSIRARTSGRWVDVRAAASN